MRTHKKKKSVRMRGTRTHGWAMKKHKGSGNRGGKGMAGSGKRADQRKTWVIKKYGAGYFGKQGFTSRKTQKIKNKIMSLENIEKNIESLISKFGKKIGKEYELDLSNYKVLGNEKIGIKLRLKVRGISKKAKEIVEKAGGEIEIIKTEKNLKKEEKKYGS